jgi:hypothetical protein
LLLLELFLSFLSFIIILDIADNMGPGDDGTSLFFVILLAFFALLVAGLFTNLLKLIFFFF